ncbi:MAG: DUF2336 domain-containing protein [Maricaulaceae bacterium]|nr:DUF2336 domain-containing protein [Maricaulaceae bacterium]
MADAFAYDTPPTDAASAPAPRSAREVLARRLADIVCLPSSRLTPQERWIVGDLLMDIMQHSDTRLRARCAERLADISEAPAPLLRLLASDTFEVARPVLERSKSLSDFDMMDIARNGEIHHRLAMAARDAISQTLTAALASMSEPPVMLALLKNPGADFAPPTLDHIVSAAKDEASLLPLLIRRPELRPAQALRLFWWCPHKERRLILDRFGVERQILIEAAADIFAMAAREGWSDPLVTRVLRYVDRRQRDRQAAAESPYGSLEGVASAISRDGASSELIEAVAQLSAVARPLIERMFDDLGGEPLAVLCKATGLDRQNLDAFWNGLGRTANEPAYVQMTAVYDMLSVEKAQTILRYWNWTASGMRR